MIKVILHGLGGVGQYAGRMMAERPYIEIVGAVVHTDKAKIGKDVGEVLGLNKKLGVIVSNSLEDVIAKTSADIVLDSTVSFVEDLKGPLFTCIKSGLNFVSACEELAYPWVSQAKLAHEIDELAKSHSVTVLGTGINPGFLQDLVPLTFAGACAKVTKITERRCNQCSDLGNHVLQQFDLGEKIEVFDKHAADGSLVAHTGHPEQIKMMADAMGWEITDIKRELKAWISKSKRVGKYATIEPGQVSNVQTVTTGYKSNGKPAIVLDFTMTFAPTEESRKEDAEKGLQPGDILTIDGEPNIDITIKGLTSAGLVTAARVANAVPYVVQAKPGLLSQKDFPVFVPIE
mgnify:CR=1 FL=1